MTGSGVYSSASVDFAVWYASIGCYAVGVGGAVGGAAVACGIYGGFVAAVWLAIIASAMSIAVGAGYTVLGLSRIAAEAERKTALADDMAPSYDPARERQRLKSWEGRLKKAAADLDRMKVAAAAKILASE